MLRSPRTLLLSAAFVFLCQSPAFSQTSPNPPAKNRPSQLWQYIPVEANLVIQSDRPRQLYDAVLNHEAGQRLQKLDSVREALETTNYRRLLQLIAYFERELGHPGPELLDRLTGGGVAFAVRFQNPPALLGIMQSKDEELLKKFVSLSVDLVKSELARQESKIKVKKHNFGSVPGYSIGKAYYARKGNTLLIASSPKVIEASLRASTGKNLANSPALSRVRGTFGDNTLAWMWADLEAARSIPNFKNGLKTFQQDLNLMFLFGALTDVIGRSPDLLVGLEQRGENFAFVQHMAAGTKGMKARALFTSEEGAGSLPLLEPPHTMASISYYLDLREVWENRKSLFSEQQVKTLEDGDKKSGPFLGGTRISTLLKKAGKYQRIVVAQPTEFPYKTMPKQQIPAFAVVLDTRDPEFGKTLNTVLRAAGIFGTFQFGMKMVEEKHAGHQLVSYYFNEKSEVRNDPQKIRFSFSPSFASVGNQFIIGSTHEITRNLIHSIDKEKRDDFSPASTRIKLFGRGGAEALRAAEDQILAQVVLNQALPPSAARGQVESLIEFVENLGSILIDVRYQPTSFRHEILWEYKH